MPNSSATAIAASGLQRASTTQAIARKPRPAVMPSTKPHRWAIDRKAPPAPARAPPTDTQAKRTRSTPMPADAAAAGYSPTALTMTPSRVEENIHAIAIAAAKVR